MSKSYALPTNNHFISLQTAVEMTTRYRNDKQTLLADPTNQTLLPICETFDLAAIQKLTAITGAAAMRIYYGMSDNKDIHSILVAVDADGRDMLPADSFGTTDD